MSQWPEFQREWNARPVPTTLTERMRENVENNLRMRFDEFLAAATGEEHRLMLDVMESWESIEAPMGTGNGEVSLAEAFSYQIEARKYIKAAPEHEKLIEQYVELLEKGEDRDEAA